MDKLPLLNKYTIFYDLIEKDEYLEEYRFTILNKQFKKIQKIEESENEFLKFLSFFGIKLI